MSLGKYRLTYTRPNQALCDEYENQIQYYIHDKEDNFFNDDFYPAWKDDRIGGMRYAMNARMEYQQKFLQNSFEDFKKNRLAEIRSLLESENSINTKKALKYERTCLTNSNSYLEFGERMELVDPYSHSIFPTNPDNNDDKKQIIYTYELIDPVIKGRYNMVQSIAYQMAHGGKLPKIESQVQAIDEKITQGLTYYNNNRNKGVYPTQKGRDEWKDELSFNHIRVHAHQAIGYTEALNDALQAITSSSEWPYVCKYFETKAKADKDFQMAHCWEKGTTDYLRQLAVPNEFNANGILSRGIDYETVRKLVQPALRDLHKAEKLYEYISNCVDEYHQYKKEHPQEIEKLIPTLKNRVSLNTGSYMDMLSQTFGTLKSLSNRMVSDHQAIYTTWEVGKETLINGSFFIPGGLVVGSGLLSLNLLTIDYQDKKIEELAKKVDFSWATRLKNSHVIEDGYNIIKEAQKNIQKNKNRLKSITDEEFRAAVKWAWENGNNSTGPIMDNIDLALEWTTLSSKEKQELKDFWEKERADAVELKKTDPDNPIIADTEKEYARFITAYRAAETGNYFVNAYMGEEIKKALKSDTNFIAFYKNATKFNDDEKKMLEDVETALIAQFSTEYEANMRTELVLKWRHAGRPKPNTQSNVEAQAELPVSNQTTTKTLNDSAEKNLTQKETFDNETYNQYNIKNNTK